VNTTLAQAKRMGAPRAIALCHCFAGALEFQAGNWTAAENALRESIHLYREIGAASGEALACQRLGALQTARGQLAEGLATLHEGQAAAERALMRAHCLTRIYAAMAHNRLAAHDLSAAEAALALGLTMSERHGNCTTCDALLLPAAISVRIAQADFLAAEDFCHQLDRAALKYASRMWVAMAQQSRGQLATARGDFDDALNRYLTAFEAFTALKHHYEAARCLAALADTHLKRGASGDVEAAQAAELKAQQMLTQLHLSLP
jgi:predicted negative regulator of RcsB-dependent stress response